MCVLGFRHCSVPASEEGGGCFGRASIGGRVGRFVPVAIVVQRGDATVQTVKQKF
jgi:hypothetical protein